MSDFAVVKQVSSTELARIRTEAQRRAATEPGHLFVSSRDVTRVDRKAAAALRAAQERHHARSETPAAVVRDSQGRPHPVAKELPAAGRPLEARVLIERMVARKLAGVARLQAFNPEAKMDIIRHMRRTRPGMLGTMTDEEAYRYFDQVVENEMRASAERVFRRRGRHATTLMGV